MTQLDRIRRMLPKALWIEVDDLPVEDANGRRLDCANLGACTSTFAGPRRRDEPEWRCPRECPDFESSTGSGAR